MKSLKKILVWFEVSTRKYTGRMNRSRRMNEEVREVLERVLVWLDIPQKSSPIKLIKDIKILLEVEKWMRR